MLIVYSMSCGSPYVMVAVNIMRSDISWWIVPGTEWEIEYV